MRKIRRLYFGTEKIIRRKISSVNKIFRGAYNLSVNSIGISNISDEILWKIFSRK